MRTKVIKLLLLFILLCSLLAISACSDRREADSVYYMVDGDVFSKQNAGEYTLPADPEREGYIFIGWYLDEGTWKIPLTPSVAESLSGDEIYARFAPAEYPIAYNLDGGVQNGLNREFYTVEMGDIPLHRPTRVGYIFEGWYNENGRRVKEISMGTTGAVNLFARWKQSGSYTVKFDPNGGVGSMPDIALTYGQTESLPYNRYEKTDCIFSGWEDELGNIYYDAGEILKKASDGEVFTLTARWRGGFGFDISNHQNKAVKINFDRLRGSVDFLILRAGFTWIGDDAEAGIVGGETREKDESFEAFYSAARKRNIPVGAYWYSCADSREDGLAEAEYLYKNCLRGKKFEFPIFMDVENGTHQTANNSGVTDAINAFCEYLESRGYYPAVYTYQNFINNFDTEQICSKYDIWYAYYSKNDGVRHDTNLSYPCGSFDIWQFSSKFSFDNGDAIMNVDANYVYRDYETFMRRFGLNGFKAEDRTAKYKSYATLAAEVRAGMWGSSDEVIRQALTEKGYDYRGVIDAVKYLKDEK